MVSLAESCTELEKSDDIIERNRRQSEVLRMQAEDFLKSGQKKDDSFYLSSSLSKLISWMVECDQNDTEIDQDGSAILTDRVIKIRRYINSTYLTLHGIDKVLIGGLYVVAPVYILPSKKVNKACKNRWKSVRNPEENGLPSNQVCDYATLKPLTSDCYIALAKFDNNYINQIVNSSKSYEYIFLT